MENCYNEVDKLRRKIYRELDGVISPRCALFDLPFHTNIGDGLIWYGEAFYLKARGIECVYNSSYFTCDFPELERDVTVLFHGGGNMGDLYHEHMNFLLKIVKRYPDNRILVFPQTVFYNDKDVCDKDLKDISAHKDIYFCARDSRSYDVVEPYFKQRALLVPDMAFCIPMSEFKSTASVAGKGTRKLMLLRKDGELSHEKHKELESYDGDILDWPTFDHKIFDGTFVFKCLAKLAHWNIPFMKCVLNNYCARDFYKRLFRIGMDFLVPYSIITTTRLHGCILGILLGKDVHLIDNSYGKNSTFYNTWLKDFDNVDLLT